MKEDVSYYDSFVRNRFITGFSVAAILCAAAYFWFLRSPVRTVEAFAGVKAGAGVVAEQSSSDAIREAVVPLSFHIAKPTGKESQLLFKHIAAATRFLQACEKENSTTVFDHEYEGLSHRTILKISPPTSEQMSAGYEEFSRGVSELQASGLDERRFRREVDSLIRDYATYPMTSKIVSISTYTNPKVTPKVDELYANDESEYLPTEDGSFVIPTHPYYRVDEDFGGKDSWAARRYSHLISIDP